MRLVLALPVLLACLVSSALSTQSAQTQDSRGWRPRLALVIVVDQMRPDYLTRFAPLYHGGLERLLKSGAIFTRAYHDHANTETAVGHATIATGEIPRRHGIVGNDWYEPEKRKYIYSCDDTCKIVGEPAEDGRSPQRLTTPTIGDWLKRDSPKSRVISIALKDRAAILMGGHSADGAFWYDRKNGMFVTSSYYPPEDSSFLNAFNGAHLVDNFYHTGWPELVADSLYHTFANNDVDSAYTVLVKPFPHSFDTTHGSPDEAYYKLLYGTPYGDELSLKFAAGAISYFHLGQNETPDLLLISCSSADAIGHAYGPSSPEIMDYYLRLDTYLDNLFATLDGTIGKDQYCTILSSDHGVMPLPEELLRHNLPGKRLWLDSVKMDIRRIGDGVAAALNLRTPLIADCGYEVVLNCDSAAAHGVPRDSLQSLVANRLRMLPYIADAYAMSELLSPAISERPFMPLFRHVARADRGPDIFIRFCEFCLPTTTPTGTSHGSPYEYDSHVPLIFAGRDIRAGTYSDSVRTVDIAPTIAAFLKIVPPDSLDGHSLWPIIHR